MQRFAPLFLLVLLIAVDAAAATLEGRVVRVVGEAVRVDWHTRDRHGRLICRLLHEGNDVNLRMVRDG